MITNPGVWHWLPAFLLLNLGHDVLGLYVFLLFTLLHGAILDATWVPIHASAHNSYKISAPNPRVP
jgi:hypothetical protein